ncbi:MAG: hypothetical protein CW338_07505, partial [Clostridiales bacterium]|nr:hypothetical protein [Clostridiales bacterium]
DLYMERDGASLAVELKNTLDFKAVRQAALRQKTADAVFIGIFCPRNLRSREFSEKLYILRRLGIGLITVSPGSLTVQVIAMPEAGELENYRRGNLRAGKALSEELRARQIRENTGGTRGRRLMTAYREDALRVLAALKELGGRAPTRQITKACGVKRASNILRDNHYSWFLPLPETEEAEEGEKKAPRERRYEIAPAGLQALEEYAGVISRVRAPAQTADETKNDE